MFLNFYYLLSDLLVRLEFIVKLTFYPETTFNVSIVAAFFFLLDRHS